MLTFVITLLNGESVETVHGSAAPIEQHTYEQLTKLPVKKLRGILEKRGLECKGCSEKSEFVTKVYENQHLPEVTPVVEESKSKSPSMDQDKIDELMASLKKGGFGNSKMFSADDLKNMSPEEISAKMGNKNKKRSGKKPAKSGSRYDSKSKSGRSGAHKTKESDEFKKAKPQPIIDTLEEEYDPEHTIEL